MEGSVYQLALTNLDGGKPHPHLVVLTFSGNRDCIVIPAYSVEGFKINEYLAATLANGVSPDAVVVQLENSQHIDFTCMFPAKEAYWCVARNRRLSLREVKQGKLIGQMKPSGMSAIAKALLAYAEKRPQEWSKNAIKSLRNLLKSVGNASGQ